MTGITPGTFQGMGGGKDNRNRQRGKFMDLMPGQMGALAQGMQMSQGGNIDKYKDFLRQTYNPTPMPMYNFGGNRGGGNGGGKNDPRPDPRTGPDGGTRPDVIGNPHSMMPMQMPQMGLLSSPMQQPQQPQRGLLGDIDPQILAYLTRR